MRKPIKDFEGLYEVDDLGNVYSVRRNKIMSPVIINSGYYTVKLSKNKILTRYLIHRLVAQAFLDNPDNLPCVNHKDEDKTNNSVDNLEWCTYQYNNSYNDKGRRISATKSIPVYQFDLNGNLIKEWKSMKEAGKSLGIDEANISAACSGKLKTYKGFIWKKITN